jgi:hypothetical protein
MFSDLISIPSIIVKVHENNSQNQISNFSYSSIFSEKFLGSQINNERWYGFFKTIDNLNDKNFSLGLWIKYQAEGKFEYEQGSCKEMLKIPRNYRWIYDYNHENPLALTLFYNEKVNYDISKIPKIQEKSAVAEAFSYLFKVSLQKGHSQRIEILEMAYKEVHNWIEINTKSPNSLKEHVKKYVDNILDAVLGEKESLQWYIKFGAAVADYPSYISTMTYHNRRIWEYKKEMIEEKKWLNLMEENNEKVTKMINKELAGQEKSQSDNHPLQNRQKYIEISTIQEQKKYGSNLIEL